MPYLKFNKIDNTDVGPVIQSLPTQGQIKLKNNNYCYLDIDDDYIHNVSSLLTVANIKKPHYFDANTDFMGAHISVIYPEEGILVNKSDVGITCDFKVVGLFSAMLLSKQYYVLGVVSADLQKIRQSYQLAEKLLWKGHLVDLHITVAVG